MYVSDMMKQKFKASGIRIKRGDARYQELKQDHVFRTNQKPVYETVDRAKREETELPDPLRQLFSRKIRSDEASHKGRVSWLERVNATEVQENISRIRNGVRKMANWKLVGPGLRS